jgi:hypothetical protein
VTRPGWKTIAGSIVLVAVAVGVATYRRGPDSTPSPGPVAEEGPEPGGPWFTDVTGPAGINFVHFDPATEHHYIQETMGSGVAWIDYDADGWPDLFLVQTGPVRPRPGESYPTCKLYRNNRDGTFTDVTGRAGLARSGFGQGVAVGDYDNDGYDDLLVTFLGGIALYHNNGNGTFSDVTEKARLHNPHWATSCAWGDVDGDGFLDLYVCNYVEVDLARYPRCEREGSRFVCPPTAFPHVAHRLFRNNGDGTFTDVTDPSGIGAASPAPGLGVVMTDVDGDGKLDIYVANDLKPQYLFHNRGNGTFAEKGALSGCGLGPTGRPISGMGVEAFDFDGSGRPSLFVTNFQNESNVLFRNRGGVRFEEYGARAGLAAPSIDRLGFGAVMIDADLDGRPDLAVANGHIHRQAEEVYRAPYAQLAQLFLGTGGGRFRDASDRAGGYFRRPRVGRGLAWADYDNDGRPDLAFTHAHGIPSLLHNDTRTANGWIGLELVGDGRRSNRNAIGARVEVETAGGTQVRFVNGGGSYLSASDRRVLVGLGPADRATRVTVRWPSGRAQVFPELAGRAYWRLTEGRDAPDRLRHDR